MTPLVSVTTRAVLPVALLISMTHLVGADQGPGDGFTAGIISSLGMTLQYITFGYAEARRLFGRMHFPYVLIAGLAVAALTAVIPLMLGAPLLSTGEILLVLPLIGLVRLSQTMVFDLAIYLVVLGGAMTAIDSLGGILQ